MNLMNIDYGKRKLKKMENKEILEFYKKTSAYTDLGCYKDFAKNLPDNIEKLCLLQRKQIIHPITVIESLQGKNNLDVSETRLVFEDDIFPTACSMINELLRLDNNYSMNRKDKNTIYVTCRGQAILLAAILKAKGYSARVRSGFAPYIKYDGIGHDHWITEYYSKDEKRWILVDPDMCLDEVKFNPFDMPREEFIFGAQAYLDLRNKKIKKTSILFASNPPTLGLKAAIRGLFYDFYSLMNQEGIFLHLPKYIKDKDFNLNENEYQELDKLATLLLEPNKNFKELQNIWNKEIKFRIRKGALN